MSEPAYSDCSAEVDGDDDASQLVQLFDGIRNRFLAGEPVLDRRRPNGRPLTNYFSPRSPSPRQYIGDALVPILRPGLSQDFLLGIKDNAAFTSMIPAILERPGFRVLAVVRDPVATLLSQQSVDLPIAQGRLPGAEPLWPELALVTGSSLDIVEKQIRIHDLFCQRYALYLQRIAIIKYEEILTSPARLFAVAGIPSPQPMPDLISPAPNTPSDNVLRTLIENRVRRLAQNGELPGICRFYPSYC